MSNDRIEEKIRVVALEQTCISCPSQWDGITDDNRKVYYRYRWGCLKVTVGAVNDMSEFAGVCGRKIFYAELSDGFDGTLSTANMLIITKGKIIHDLLQANLDAMQ